MVLFDAVRQEMCVRSGRDHKVVERRKAVHQADKPQVAACLAVVLLLAKDASRVDMQGTANRVHNGDQSRQKHGECNRT